MSSPKAKKNLLIKQIVPTKLPNISAHVNITKKDDGTAKIRGYAVYKDTQIRVDKSKVHTHVSPFSTDEAISVRVQYVVSDIQAEFAPTRDHSPKISGKAGIFSQRYQAIEDIDNLRKPEWGASTFRKVKTYFERQVLPRMDVFGFELSDADMAQIQDELVRRALNSGRKGGREAITKQSVAGYLSCANYIYRRLREQYPELPDVEFPLPERTSVAEREQAKAIPDDIRVKLARLLVMLCPNNGLAVGVAIMWFMGLRTAEAAAVRIGDLILRDTYVVYSVSSQIQGKKPCGRLKSNAAYRVAIGPYILHECILARIEYLRQQGYQDDAIMIMPAVSLPSAPDSYISTSKLSDYAKNLLIKCGYKQHLFAAAEALQNTEPDKDSNGLANLDVTCYVLRRDFCSRATNTCGMSAYDIDYLLGHAGDKPTKDYTSEDVQSKLAAQLERFVFLPSQSKNPIFSPLHLSAGSTKDLDGFTGYRLVNAGDTPLTVIMQIYTREPGDSIQAVVNNMSVKIHRERGKRDDPEQRRNRTIITPPQSSDYYNNLKMDAIKFESEVNDDG